MAALAQGEVAEFGRLMNASHESLRDDYQVSCAELDCLVKLARGEDACLGARMTGGGFGGAVVVLMRSGGEQQAAERVLGGYRREMGREGAWLLSRPSAGGSAERQRGQG